MECTLCEYSFDEEGRRPKLLGCGHTFCLSCLLGMEAKTLDRISCPTCREQVPLRGVTQLKDNYLVFSVLRNGVARTRRISISRLWCVDCDIEAKPDCESDGHDTRGLVGFRRRQARVQLEALERLEAEAEGALREEVRECLQGLREGRDPWEELLGQAERLLEAGRSRHQVPQQQEPKQQLSTEQKVEELPPQPEQMNEELPPQPEQMNEELPPQPEQMNEELPPQPEQMNEELPSQPEQIQEDLELLQRRWEEEQEQLQWELQQEHLQEEQLVHSWHQDHDYMADDHALDHSNLEGEEQQVQLPRIDQDLPQNDRPVDNVDGGRDLLPEKPPLDNGNEDPDLLLVDPPLDTGNEDPDLLLVDPPLDTGNEDPDLLLVDPPLDTGNEDPDLLLVDPPLDTGNEDPDLLLVDPPLLKKNKNPALLLVQPPLGKEYRDGHQLLDEPPLYKQESGRSLEKPSLHHWSQNPVLKDHLQCSWTPDYEQLQMQQALGMHHLQKGKSKMQRSRQRPGQLQTAKSALQRARQLLQQPRFQMRPHQPLRPLPHNQMPSAWNKAEEQVQLQLLQEQWIAIQRHLQRQQLEFQKQQRRLDRKETKIMMKMADDAQLKDQSSPQPQPQPRPRTPPQAQPQPEVPDELDYQYLNSLSSTGPRSRMLEKTALLRREGVSVLRGLWCSYDPAWVHELLQRQAETLRELQLEMVGRYHLLLVVQSLHQLRRLRVRSCKHDLVEEPALPEQCRAQLQLLDAQWLPRDTVQSLLRAHRGSLEELVLCAGTPPPAGEREDWPHSCADLAALLRGLGLPRLRRLRLERPQGRHAANLCPAQLARLRAQLPAACAVTCVECDDDEDEDQDES